MYDVLFAPSRGEYAGKGKPPVDCIFCAIRDEDPRVWTRLIYKDDQVIVLMNIFPYSPGHIQVIPARHVETIADLSDPEIEYSLDYVQRSLHLARQVMRPDGFNIGMNLGEAGASIAHLHFQIVPRYLNKPAVTEQADIHRLCLDNVGLLSVPPPRRRWEKKKRAKRPRYPLRSDDVLISYLSERPYNRGHVIISPRSDNVDSPPHVLAHLLREVQRVEDALRAVYHPVGLNIGANIGSVPNASDTLKIHVVPRFDPESGFMEVIGDTRVVIETLDQTYKKLVAVLK